MIYKPLGEQYYLIVTLKIPSSGVMGGDQIITQRINVGNSQHIAQEILQRLHQSKSYGGGAIQVGNVLVDTTYLIMAHIE
ncbi:MAG: hypothetical protein MUE54_10095 [Anaerolineae bacterium]|jgi:hypothetical protein|nr:hypothetical protein [Anaerolineae bacterium]